MRGRTAPNPQRGHVRAHPRLTARRDAGGSDSWSRLHCGCSRQAELCGCKVWDSGPLWSPMARTETSTFLQGPGVSPRPTRPYSHWFTSYRTRGPLQVVLCKLFTVQRRTRGPERRRAEAAALAQTAMWTASQEALPEAGKLLAPASMWSCQPTLGKGLSAGLIQLRTTQNLLNHRKLSGGGAF